MGVHHVGSTLHAPASSRRGLTRACASPGCPHPGPPSGVSPLEPAATTISARCRYRRRGRGWTPVHPRDSSTSRERRMGRAVGYLLRGARAVGPRPRRAQRGVLVDDGECCSEYEEFYVSWEAKDGQRVVEMVLVMSEASARGASDSAADGGEFAVAAYGDLVPGGGRVARLVCSSRRGTLAADSWVVRDVVTAVRRRWLLMLSRWR